MRNFLFTIFTLTIILLASCNTSKKVANKIDSTDNFCEAMTFNSTTVDNISTDYYSIDSLFIEKDCLNIWVSYSGGCGDSDFKLYFSNIVNQSAIPETRLLLQLIDNDPCKAIVQQKLYYNLSFFDEYKINNGILLELSGTNKSVMYSRLKSARK